MFRFKIPGLLGASLLFLVLGDVAQADVITVGTGNGVDAKSIGAGIALALATPADDEIRVQGPAVFAENVTFTLDAASGELEISGGWDVKFTTRTEDPSLSVIDGDGGRVFDVTLSTDASFVLSNITVQNGGGVVQGAGLRLIANQARWSYLYHVIFADNAVTAGSTYGKGGAVFLDLVETDFGLDVNFFIDNSAVVPNPPPTVPEVQGGSIWAYLSQGSSLELYGNVIQGSSCTSAAALGQASGCAVWVSLNLDSDLFGFDNVVVGSQATGLSSVSGVAAYLDADRGSHLSLNNNRWQGATVTDVADPVSPLMVVKTFEYATAIQQSSLLADGGSDGVSVECFDTSTWYGVNLTVAGNDGVGVTVGDPDGTATLALSNSIIFGNGVDTLDGDVSNLAQLANLVGVDSSFTNFAAGDYHLRPDSLALNAGDSSPPGDLSSQDLDGAPRVQDGVVDIGAYEGAVEEVFADNFDAGDLDAWSGASP